MSNERQKPQCQKNCPDDFETELVLVISVLSLEQS